MTEAPVVDASVEYPTSDGRPVAETPLHYSRLADAAARPSGCGSSRNRVPTWV